ncbi:MAG: response regulator transcription factor [Nitrospirae bacterium]|nr:response regulator transcription factor [Nitrospirota bacterium]
MKILIVEDERRLARILKQGLEENSFFADLAFDGEEGLYMAETFPYDAIILDVRLPLMDGFAVLEKLRANGVMTPIVMLTARAEVVDKVRGLNAGADDYLPKPFDFSELLARLKSALRRGKGNPSPIISIEDLLIDTNGHVVTRAGVNIKLSATEYALLLYLAMNKGRVVSRAELLDHIYDSDSDRDSNVIDVYVNYLRNKIDKGFSAQLIHTVRGSGYMLKKGASGDV